MSVILEPHEPLAPERFEIRTLIGELVDTVGPLVHQGNNTLTVKCGADVGAMRADLRKTRQILQHLLSNAARFTRDGVIAIDVRRLTVRGRATIQFAVTDTGVGMTREQIGTIFDAFTQADVTTTRKNGGTGLGLAIVSRFCELMGGSVSVESRPGHGSSFFVHLPATAVDGGVAAADRFVESTTPAAVRRASA
jgi:signal transduction histidine kinase